ncbi:MAG: glutathione S-transferase family protein [Actinomycetota bacterium]|nr:glutathione S-transferase family protein [Actinomycetota bacterium]
MTPAPPALPVLWQLQLSHYNEKVRWALDYKRIPHRRRSLLPGVHVLVARHLTPGSETTPVLTLDGRSIGDSTQILAALEERFPQPPLYPSDPQQRARTLELEDFFDERLGPHVRRGVYEVLLDKPGLVVPMFTNDQPPAARLLFRATFPMLRTVMRRKLRINRDAAERSRAATVTAMDRLEAELGPSGYLVGDGFSAADLTAAALFYPVVRPPEFPYPLVAEVPERGREFLESLASRPGGRWVTEIYARHRRAGRLVGVALGREALGRGRSE